MFEQARDLLTNELFIKMRSNQKFANPQNRIRFNNLKAQKKRAEKAPIDRILDYNRTILKEILGPKSEVTVSKDYLLGAGFSFGIYSYHKEVNGVVYTGIYKYGITKVSNDNYKLVKLNNGQTAGNR